MKTIEDHEQTEYERCEMQYFKLIYKNLNIHVRKVYSISSKGGKFIAV
jgi:hypothetical protein